MHGDDIALLPLAVDGHIAALSLVCLTVYFGLFAPQGQTQVQRLVGSLGDGDGDRLALGIIARDAEAEVLADVLGIDVLVDVEVATPLGIEERGQQRDDAVAAGRAAVGAVEIAAGLHAVGGGMVAATAHLGVLCGKHVVDHQPLHGIGILRVARQLEQHLAQLHPRHGGTTLHDVACERLHVAVLVVLGHADATRDVHLAAVDVVPSTLNLAQQRLVARDAVEAQESHEVHVERVRVDVGLQLIDRQRAVGHGVEARERVPAAPAVDARNHPLRPVQILPLARHLIEPRHGVAEQRTLPAIMDAVPGKVRRARQLLAHVLRPAQFRRPELLSTLPEVLQKVVCQPFRRLQRPCVARLFIDRRQRVEHEVQLVGIHASDGTLRRAIVFGRGTEIALRFLRVDDAVQFTLCLFQQFLVAALDGRQVGRLNPLAMLFRLRPYPVAMLTVCYEVHILVDGELL